MIAPAPNSKEYRRDQLHAPTGKRTAEISQGLHEFCTPSACSATVSIDQDV